MNWFVAGLALNLVVSLHAVTKKQVNPYDPGICTSKNRGKIVVVKGRNEDDIIVACVEREHGKYKWDTIKGYSYGNYFDPAKDCSHVVDNLPKATSRVYWIQTENGPKKAWCDVDTDGGGFMLIGVHDKPAAWSIPSKSSLVHPHGDAIWSSTFGGRKVLDFRVQISTSKDFQDTRAHWYYRFQSPRNLSKLLMFDKGGCSHQYPGIGRVAYVKDLMTRNIATKKFQCSRFGASISPGLGWDKMNKCFKESCPYGFAYLHNYHIDRSGSYSYSSVSANSGIQDNQTSFVGCDHGECCACFGPDSKKDYCAPRCKAINGGTVLREKDNITVWFWIRSSSPKRVVLQNSVGKLEAWHVLDGIKRKMTDVIKELERFKKKMGGELAATFKKDLEDNYESCKQIWASQSNSVSGVYKIRVGRSQVTNVYCQMSSVSNCSGGGWTMVMKIDGSSNAFQYNSSYWTNKNTYQDYGLTGFDKRQLKASTYWRTSFHEICVAMKYNGSLKAVPFWYPANSLFSLIAHGQFLLGGRKGNDGGSTVHDIQCYMLAFNPAARDKKMRLAALASPNWRNKRNCLAPESIIGLGYQDLAGFTCGSSIHTPDDCPGPSRSYDETLKNRTQATMFYVLIR